MVVSERCATACWIGRNVAQPYHHPFLNPLQTSAEHHWTFLSPLQTAARHHRSLLSPYRHQWAEHTYHVLSRGPQSTSSTEGRNHVSLVKWVIFQVHPSHQSLEDKEMLGKGGVQASPAPCPNSHTIKPPRSPCSQLVLCLRRPSYEQFKGRVGKGTRWKALQPHEK